MPFKDNYKQQVRLLVSSLPAVAEESCFALKGGTAINLFVRNMPRLSVDIDLTYLPVVDRNRSLQEIDETLKRIGERLKNTSPRMNVTESGPSSQDTINKLVLQSSDRTQIKIEVTPVLRGCVYEPADRVISEKAEDQFGFAEIKVLSFADLYAGKIMAALDRQHPRDLFDVYYLLENERITEELRTAIIVYLVSHNRPPQMLLSPNLKDIYAEYENNFVGMTEDEIILETLESTREVLIKDICTGFTDDQKQFLYSFYRREPQWDLLGIEGLDQLPAIKWRELNLDKAGKETQEETAKALEELL